LATFSILGAKRAVQVGRQTVVMFACRVWRDAVATTTDRLSKRTSAPSPLRLEFPQPMPALKSLSLPPSDALHLDAPRSYASTLTELEDAVRCG
jgi:hypothetical protein